MATFPSFPPIPNDPIGETPSWREWFHRLQVLAMTKGNALFSQLNFTGSNLTSLATRNHNDLQNIQGGAASQNYHLNATQYSNATNVAGLTASGYSYLPNGLIIQWGTVTAAAGGTTVTLPITFPNTTFVIVASSRIAGNIAAAIFINTSSATIYNSGGQSTHWFATGY